MKTILPIALVLIAIAGGVFGYFYYTTPTPTPVDPSTIFNGYFTMKERDFELNKQFTDANGDLVADHVSDAKEPDVLTFTEIPSGKPEKDEVTWAPLIQHLTASTGKPWKYLKKLPNFEAMPPKAAPPSEPGDEASVALPDYVPGSVTAFDDQLEAMQNGSLHLTAFTTGQVRRAVNTVGFVPLVVPASQSNDFSYQLQIVVAAKSSIQNLSDLKGKMVAIPALSSNSGAKAVFTTLEEKAQLNPRSDYTIKIVAGYKAGLKDVANGQCDAMGIASDLFAREVKAGTVNPNDFRLIDTKQMYPKLCYGVSHRLPKALADKIQAALLSFKFTGNSVGVHFAGDAMEKYTPISYKKDWETVRMVDEKLLQILKK
ncbi:MAG: PhnD/SsuA/transferrin family substrate-binding protein [Fimbriiglobus sp.]